MKKITNIRLALIMLSAVLFCTWIVNNAFGAVPLVLNIQGRLLDVNDKPLPDGTYKITIRLYNQSENTGANSIYEEKDKSVDVKGGIFSTTIGEQNQIPTSAFDSLVWVGIQLGNDAEMYPRLKLSTVPTSFHSQTSEVSLYSIQSDTADYVRHDNLPIGSVVAFAGGRYKVPQNWMICEGQTLNSKDYPDLFNVIGFSWGTSSGADKGNDKGIYFNLPDMRGMFLRGVDNGAGNDPDANSRQASHNGGNVGDTVGTLQAATILGDVNGDGMPDVFSHTNNFNIEQTSKPQDEALSFNGSNANAYTTEMRPINVYVYYIIKVK
jgi:microcystin-dependent protein